MRPLLRLNGVCSSASVGGKHIHCDMPQRQATHRGHKGRIGYWTLGVDCVAASLSCILSGTHPSPSAFLYHHVHHYPCSRKVWYRALG